MCVGPPGPPTYLIGALDLTVGTSKNFRVKYCEFDGRRTGTVDIPARWGAYFTRSNGIEFSYNRVNNCDSDGATFEFVNGGRVWFNTCNNNVKPGLYFSCCDRMSVGANVSQNAVGVASYGIAIASTWYSTFVGNITRNNPIGGLGFGRDSQFCTVVGGVVEAIGTETEAMPVGYQPYLDTVDRPGRMVADGTTLGGAHNITVNGTIIANRPGSNINGVNLRNSHGWTFEGAMLADHGRHGLSLQGSRNCRFRGGSIGRVSKVTADNWSVLAVPLLGINCDGLELDGVRIWDDQAVPTGRGIQVANEATTGVVYRNLTVDLPSGNFPLYEDAGTAPAFKENNKFGLTRARGQDDAALATVTGTRANATNYTAPAGRPITVYLTLTLTNGASGTITVNGVVVGSVGNGNAGSVTTQLSFTVRPGQVYRTDFSGVTIVRWVEER
jgi:hypothetical protein